MDNKASIKQSDTACNAVPEETVSAGSVSNNGSITIRDATLADAPRLLEIYRYYVENTAITFEITVPTLSEFQRRMQTVMECYPYLVAEEHRPDGNGGRILGYSYVHAFVGREAYVWSVETTIYLDPTVRRQGLGRKLYTAMEDILRRMHILNLNACIGYPSAAGGPDDELMRNSARFHAHMGYQKVGEFHCSGYKFGRWYDMIWMEKMLGTHPAQPEAVLRYQDLDIHAAEQ